MAVWSVKTAKSEYKVIPYSIQDEPQTWEQALNQAASDGWELVSTGTKGEMGAAPLE